MSIRQTFIEAVERCEELPAKLKEIVSSPLAVEESRFDQSYLEFLDQQIELNARGNEWTNRLRHRREGLAAMCDTDLISGRYALEDDEYWMKVDPALSKVVYWEVYEGEYSNQRIRPLKSTEIPLMVSYFLSCSAEDYYRMGVDSNKLPSRSEWIDLLTSDLEVADKEKKFFYLGWEHEGELIGHSNINQIEFGNDARVHLHVWNPEKRNKGIGRVLFNQSLDFFAKRFQLQKIFCEPHVKNVAPNRTLPKVGFELVESIETVPGWINFRQTINRFCRDFPMRND